MIKELPVKGMLSKVYHLLALYQKISSNRRKKCESIISATPVIFYNWISPGMQAEQIICWWKIEATANFSISSPLNYSKAITTGNICSHFWNICISFEAKNDLRTKKHFENYKDKSNRFSPLLFQDIVTLSHLKKVFVAAIVEFISSLK